MPLQNFCENLRWHSKKSSFLADFLKIFLQIKVVAAVEVAVADGFHDVVLADGDAAFEVGDGAGNFQDAVVGAGAHVHLGDDLAQLLHAFGVGFGVFVQQGCCHLGVAVHSWMVLEA